MIDVDLQGPDLIVKAGPRDTRFMKLVPGARYIRALDAWRTPCTRAQLAGLRGMFPDATYTDEASRVIAQLWATAQKQELARTSDRPIKGREYLYPFQAAGVRFIGHGKNVLLADEMGTGKTVQSLVAVELEQAWPLLVICPNSVKHNWAKEVSMWTEASPYVIGGTAKQRREQIEAVKNHTSEYGNPAVAIINYESLILHTSHTSFGNRVVTDKDKAPKELNEIDWAAVICDEAHKLKEPKNKTPRSAWSVSEDARMRIALTGTPIVNNPDDLWSIMRFVEPQEWPARSRFRDRYCDVYPGYFGGLENRGISANMVDELDEFLQPRLIRRTKAEVLVHLPPKTVTKRLIPIGGKQAIAYRQMVKHMMAELKDGQFLTAADPLTLLGRLRYLASAYAELDDEGNVTALSTPSNKLDAITDILDEGGSPLVVYAQSRKLIELFDQVLSKSTKEKPGYKTGLITGKVPPAVRQANVDMFQDGKLDIILATTGAGAEGITLTRSSRLVMAMADWSNVANKQAFDRIHRIGQENHAEILVLMSEGTIDLAVDVANELKEDQLQRVVRDPHWIEAALKGQL